MAGPRTRAFLTVAVFVLSLGCQAVAPARPTSPGRGGAPRAVKASVTPSLARQGEPRRIPQQGQQTRLTGVARLIAHPGGALVSDQGGSLIGDQGGSLIGDQGGSLISNNGGAVIGNSGTSKPATRRVLQAGPGLGVYGLADAEIRLYDAAGRLLVDDAGMPLAATTGPDATFKLQAVLPPGNLVARIQLWNGGELSAIVARDGAQQASLDLTTASSLGASYVMGLVKGDQAILNKLPRAESDRLNRELDVVRGFAKGAFRHETATLDAITAKLRLRVPAVDQVAEDVRALLLGQAKLGAGLEATKVPLAGPVHLTVSREGRLLIGEQLPGRVRELQADGTLATLLDKTHGRIKNNAPTLRGLVTGQDGSLYTAVRGARRVYRIPLAGDIEVVLGTGKRGRDAPGRPTEMSVNPSCVAWGPDGTLWVGEEGLENAGAPRLLALRPDGRVEAFPSEEPTGGFHGLAVAPSGDLYAVLGPRLGDAGHLWRHRPETGWKRLATGLSPGSDGGLCVTSEGQVLVSDAGQGRVLALQADDTLAPLEGLTPGPLLPGSLAAHPDGRVFIADWASSVVWEKPREGPARVVAGTAAVFQAGETQGFAINAPTSLTADDQGRLYISESGSHTVKRFDGRTLAVVAGQVRGAGSDVGDGGPAAEARLNEPRGIWWEAGTLYVLDNGNRRVRRVGPDGVIRAMAAGADLANDWGLTLGPDGRPWWSGLMRGTLGRMTPGGGTETAVGQPTAGNPQMAEMLVGLAAPVGPDPATLRMTFPTGVVRDPNGHIVFCDGIAGRIYRLRTSGPQSGTLEWVAGIPLQEALNRAEAVKAGIPEPSPEGARANDVWLSIPLGLAYDAKGNLYVAESGDRNIEAMASMVGGDLPLPPDLLPGTPPRVRRITPDGIISTVAGPGGNWFPDPDGEDALYAPTSLAVMSDGRLAIGDLGSNLVRILPAGSY